MEVSHFPEFFFVFFSSFLTSVFCRNMPATPTPEQEPNIHDVVLTEEERKYFELLLLLLSLSQE